MLTDYTDEESLMEIKFIAHSGFLVRLPSADLLFDYFRGELPEPEPGKPMFVFVSHAHADHFSKEIFSLAGKSSLVTFLLSDDIPWTEVPEECERQAEFLGPDMELSFPFPNGGELTVRTYLSTDEGIAFLVDADGARIYHAGDLNDWVWAGAPPGCGLRAGGQPAWGVLLDGNGRIHAEGRSKVSFPHASLRGQQSYSAHESAPLRRVLR